MCFVREVRVVRLQIRDEAMCYCVEPPKHLIWASTTTDVELNLDKARFLEFNTPHAELEKSFRYWFNMFASFI